MSIGGCAADTKNDRAFLFNGEIWEVEAVDFVTSSLKINNGIKRKEIIIKETEMESCIVWKKHYKKCEVCGEWMDLKFYRKDIKAHYKCANRARHAKYIARKKEGAY